ncbi:leucine-rich repeat-containing protein 41 [Hyperolius riggenbachi]|uniref:leucine-rich repeat-containing protein 41 n=1 Tax=Hyperolius riggenbachi TaxID=752182 RepID=UPI0035A33F4C
MEEVPEDAGESLSLFQLCARAVTANMERLEEEVWGLPAVILQGLLPLLNIYYLERIEPTAVKKGLSTQSIWYKLWNDIMKNKPTRFMTVTCWRKKFLETLFHSVLRGTLDVSSDSRLYDHRFSPLEHSSRHVSELTIFGKQQGVSEFTPTVLERLSQSVECLKLLHLRLSDPETQKHLRLLLHHLIHHGQVHKLSVLSWPRPDKELLVMILTISAGYWPDHTNLPCTVCAQAPECHPPQNSWGPEEVGSQSALLSLQPLNINQNVPPDHLETGTPGSPVKERSTSETMALEQYETGASGLKDKGQSANNENVTPEQPQAGIPGSLVEQTGHNTSNEPDHNASTTSVIRSVPGPEPQGSLSSDSNDLYDFIFTFPSATESEDSANEDSVVAAPLLQSSMRFRGVRALNLHSVFLTPATCSSLCQLLRSWVTLERLTMAYNDIQTNISLLLDALSELSRDPRCSLTAFSLSDFITYISTLDLAQIILRTFPGLQSLLLCYDVEESSDRVVVAAEPAEFTENRLKQLDLRFPHNPLDVERLVSALKASPSLVELSLDNSVILLQEDVKRVLMTITEYNPALRRLSFDGLNMTDVQVGILHLMNHSRLEEIKFSYCRLFEKTSKQFFAQFVAALKKNPTLKILKLSGNRLRNKGFIALADLYAADSSSSVHYLDVSSNCITSPGLLQFAKKLEGHRNVKLRQLCVTMNPLDLDNSTTHNALKSLETVCHVVKDNWDPAHALADHVGDM